MATFLQDLRFTLRHLRKSPGFAFSAILTLALGIGATTAIFSTVNAALLKPLPYPKAGDLYGLRTTLTDGRVTTGLVSPVELMRLNVPNISVEHAAGTIQNDLTLLRDDGQPVKTQVFGVTEGFFELFGQPMTLGGFTPNSYVANGPPNALVISRRAWRDLVNSDPAIVGKPVRFAELTMNVAGVAPEGFDVPHNADFWAAFRPNPTDVGHSWEGYVRLKPGSSLAQAKGEMGGIMDGVAREYPASAKNRIYVMKPLVDQIVGDLSSILLVVLSATGLLLVLSCVNVTNLLLARGAARAREMAVRVALGASRGRIVRQLLTESAILATVGAISGLALAYGGIRLMMSAGAGKLPRLDAVSFDSNVLMFALVTMAVCGVIVGFAPALRLAATDLKTLMNETGRSASGGRATARWLSVLMVTEVALSVMLVAGAGWLVRSFANLRTVDPGFKTEGRVIFDVSLQNQQKFPNGPAIDAAFQELQGRLRQLPGVTAVGASSNFPLKLALESSLLMQFKGEPFDAANPMGTRQRIVSPGFFNAMGTKLLAGRDFTDADRQGTAPVAIINKTFAQRYLKGRDPIGIHFLSGYPDINPQSEVEIVGVVDDIRQKTIMDPAEPSFYSTDRQFVARRRTMVLHTNLADPMSLQSAIRSEVGKSDPNVAVDVTLLSSLVGDGIQRQALGMRLMLIFGIAALILAAVGIYGVIAYAATERRGEVATRLALGATRGTVFWLMMRRGRTLALIGAVIGLAAAYIGGRFIASRLYQVSASDPWILGAATVVVAAIALGATVIPAFRSSRLDPVNVLRPE
jgi:putative ABC transport system permease protein